MRGEGEDDLSDLDWGTRAFLAKQGCYGKPAADIIECTSKTKLEHFPFIQALTSVNVYGKEKGCLVYFRIFVVTIVTRLEYGRTLLLRYSTK